MAETREEEGEEEEETAFHLTYRPPEADDHFDRQKIRDLFLIILALPARKKIHTGEFISFYAGRGPG